MKSTNLLIKCYSSTGSSERWTFFPGRFFFAFRIGQVTAISAKSQDPGCLKLLWIVLYPAPDVKNPHHELTSSKAHRLILGCLSCQSFLKDIHKTLQNHFSVESNAQISDVALSSKLEAWICYVSKRQKKKKSTEGWKPYGKMRYCVIMFWDNAFF